MRPLYAPEQQAERLRELRLLYQRACDSGDHEAQNLSLDAIWRVIFCPYVFDP